MPDTQFLNIFKIFQFVHDLGPFKIQKFKNLNTPDTQKYSLGSWNHNLLDIFMIWPDQNMQKNTRIQNPVSKVYIS